MGKHLYALVDCNNFFASCERIFRPDLKGKPIVVLSNNDGCVVARSAEAKAMGIQMCAPYFKLKDRAGALGLVAFSSNYALYADISRRVMDTLEQICEKVEVYSIDEAFLNITGYRPADHGGLHPVEWGRKVRARVYQWTGIRVGVGIAPSKTLAKAANHLAKQQMEWGGVLDLTDEALRKKLLSRLPVREIWGIGRKTALKLQGKSITTAQQLAEANPEGLRRLGGVVLERTCWELRGIACLERDPADEPKHQMVCSRSFGRAVTEFRELREAVSRFCEQVCRRMRKYGQYAGSVTVFISTGSFQSEEKTYSNGLTTLIPGRTRDARQIRRFVVQLVERLWRDGFAYKKAGVILGDLSLSPELQRDLFTCRQEEDCQGRRQERNEQLMAALDRLNAGGRRRIWYAAEGVPGASSSLESTVASTSLPAPAGAAENLMSAEIRSLVQPSSPEWEIRREILSPSYTTNWEQIPVVK